MVLSLQALCLVRIRDGVESGTFTQSNVNGFSNIPPVLRELILNKVLMNRTINYPNCTEILGSTEFLRGFWSLDTQNGKENDNRYLDRVAESLATILPNGEAMGAKIEKLSLNLYVYYTPREDVARAYHRVCTSNFGSVVHLIAQCPNLVSLDLRVVRIYLNSTNPLPEMEDETSTWWVRDSTDGGLLNEIAARPCLSVLENLRELSLEGDYGTRLLVNGPPIIRFKQLTKLHLRLWDIFTDAWSRVLQRVKGTLTELCGETLQFLPEREEHAHLFLPFPLPRLETLKLSGCVEVEYSQQFVQNLSECDKLDYARLELGPRTMDEQLATLASIGALDIDVADSDLIGLDNEDFLADRFFKLADLFRGKVKSFDVLFEPKYTAAFKRALDACSNLTTLTVWFESPDMEDEREVEEKRRLAEARRYLGSLFNDRERASKLTEIDLFGNLGDDILKSLFNNCLHLHSLRIQDCPQLTDERLIEWAEYGARPRELKIEYCRNISDAGLIAVVISFGECFSKLEIIVKGNDQISSRAWRIVIDNCPNVGLARVSEHGGDVFGVMSTR